MKVFIATFLLLGAFAAMAGDGRYQIVFNPNVRADTFLVDTQTGKVWTKKCMANESKSNSSSNCAISAWSQDEVLDLSIKSKDFWRYVEEFEKKNP